MSTKALRNAAIVSFVVALAFLLIGGLFALDKVPPIPEEVVGPDGEVAITRDDIMAGQQVYQRYGLMDHGSIWGHGSLRGMDFSTTSLLPVGIKQVWHSFTDGFWCARSAEFYESGR